jgi:hypothetical protein
VSRLLSPPPLDGLDNHRLGEVRVLHSDIGHLRVPSGAADDRTTTMASRAKIRNAA